MPYDSEMGNRYIRETIRSVEEMDLTDSDRKKIFEGNAMRVLNLSHDSSHSTRQEDFAI
jgi:hypothetical protein